MAKISQEERMVTMGVKKTVYYGRAGTERTFNNCLLMELMSVPIFKRQMEGKRKESRD